MGFFEIHFVSGFRIKNERDRRSSIGIAAAAAAADTATTTERTSICVNTHCGRIGAWDTGNPRHEKSPLKLTAWRDHFAVVAVEERINGMELNVSTKKKYDTVMVAVAMGMVRKCKCCCLASTIDHTRCSFSAVVALPMK
jgi:hypothetical protein